MHALGRFVHFVLIITILSANANLCHETKITVNDCPTFSLELFMANLPKYAENPILDTVPNRNYDIETTISTI